MERVEAGVAGVGGGEGGRNLVKYQVFQLRTLPVGIREAEREKIQRFVEKDEGSVSTSEALEKEGKNH